MQTLRITLAAFFTILFIITGLIALFLFNIEQKAFSADTYKRAFESRGLYDRMPAILGTALADTIRENPVADQYLKSITPQDWQGIISALLPPQELKITTDSALDSTFEYLNDRRDSAVISLLPFKIRLVSPAGADAVLLLLQAQPACTPDQLLAMAIGILNDGRLAFCNPPPEAQDLLRPIIESQLQWMSVLFPDEVTLISSERSGTPDDPRRDLRVARTVMRITPFLPLAFLLGLTIFAVRGLADWLRWWGWPFLLTGGTGFLIAMTGAPLFGIIFQSVMEREAAGLIPESLLLALRETASAVVSEVLEPAGIQGLILAVLGLGAVVLGEFIGKYQRAQRLNSYRPRM